MSQLLSLILITFLSVSVHAKFDFSKYVSLVEQKQFDSVIQKLQAVPDKEFDYSELQVKYFALGKWFSDLGQWPKARENLEVSLKYGRLNAAYVFYLIGHSYKEEQKYDKASEAFNRALDHNPSQFIIFQSRFELSEMAMLQKQNAKAFQHLKYLERRWRGTPKYTEVLWRLTQVELRSHRKHLACRWARKLYSKYPADPLTLNWGVELSQNQIDGQKLGCLASYADTKKRLQNLLLAGQDEKAKKEIDWLYEKTRGQNRYEIDLLLVTHLERRGFPDEALKVLLPHYEARRKQMGYLNLLGKVASRAGEFQTAIGAYESASRLSPNSRSGKEALFTAAFLSYQIQDYDGAYRKFSSINKKFSGSGLARDARWHLAWLKYLKADYAGAEVAFSDLLKEKKHLKRRRVVRPFANDRTKYWLAMSQLKQGKTEVARLAFTPLAENKAVSYYAILAKNRLKQLPEKQVARPLASTAEVLPVEVDSGEAETATVDPGQLFSPKVTQPDDEEESEVKLQAESDEESAGSESENQNEESDGPKLVAGEDSDPTEDDKVESVTVSAFKDPRLQLRFDSANLLIHLGLNEWAKWELFEIERRTRNKTYLRTLMEFYIKIGSYNRASYIAEIYFSNERMQKDKASGKEIWQYNYPQAYKNLVNNWAKKFGVDESLVFAIMKAESHFNKEAYSPVGARGLMQIMPYTANHLSRLMGEGDVASSDLLQPEVNIRLGTRYLARLQKKFQGQVPLVAAGYNAGPHRVNGWLNSFGILDMDEFIEHVPFVETRDYMKKVVRNFALYNELYKSKPVSYSWLTQPVPVRVSERPAPRENWEIID